MERLLRAESIPIEKPHGGGTYAKTWRGVARRLERAYVDKGEDEPAEGQRDAYQRYFELGTCDVCGGLRLNPRALAITVDGVGIGDAVQLALTDLDTWLTTLHDPIADPLVTKMRRILAHLIEIGVGYLSLNRSVATLSGGESQRVKMARQLDCNLIGMMYVVDEPSIGLHPRDVAKLVDMLRRLRDKGNSVLVVEHDATVISAADHVIEIGPGAGRGGGEVCFSGTFEAFRRSATRTAVLMRAGPSVAQHRRRAFAEVWRVRGARANNLRDVDVDIPQGVLVAVTGVAGSGKSSLVHDEFVARHPGAIVVDQNAIGRSSRSNPVTYLGVFDVIRRHFAAETGESAALFSFNSKGACPTCKGQGSISIEMSFLDDVNVTCSDCGGRRYTDEALALTWRNLSIHDVLSLTARAALDVFEHPPIRRPLTLLCEVGLDYLTLGQPLSTLSGGESQRIKLVTELGKSGNLYVLDEPTTGLHMADVERLMAILNRLVDDGNSVVIIEHNLDVIAQADWVIDLGPEGGDAGGRLVAAGTPETIAAAPESHTGRYLAARLRTARGAGAPAYRVDESPLAG